MIPVISITPPEPAPPAALLDTLVETCTGSLAEGRCALSSSRLLADEEVVTLVVLELAEDGSVTLRIGKPRRPHEWTEQPVRFDPEDPLAERYRAMGLLTASLGAARTPELGGQSTGLRQETFSESSPSEISPGEEADNANGSPAEPPAPAAGREAVPSATEDESAQTDATEVKKTASDGIDTERDSSLGDAARSSSLHAQLQLGATSSQALRRESTGSAVWRPGAVVRAGLGHRALPLLVEAGFGMSGSPRTEEGLSLRFVTGEAGLSYDVVWASADLGLRPSARVLVEQVRARARSRVVEATVEQSRWTWGLSLGLGLSYPHSTTWGLVMEAEYLSYDGATGIEINGDRLGRVPAHNARGFLGLVVRIR